jgi:hypothetical protein
MRPKFKRNPQAGFSMMELMIALATMTIITGCAFALIGGSLKFSNATYHITDAEETLRTAHEIINRDLTTAGDGLKGIGTITVPIGFVNNYLTQTPIVNAGAPSYVNLALVTSDDNLLSGVAIPQATPAATALTGCDRITMLTQDYTNFPPISLPAGRITQSGSNTNIVVNSTDISKFQPGEIYAIQTQNSAAFGVITTVNSSTNTLTMTNGDAYGINQTNTGTPIYTIVGLASGPSGPAAISRWNIIHYFVNSNNLMIRRAFGVKGAGFSDSVVAEHVVNLQFRYLINLVDVNGFVPQPVRQLSTSQQQLAVREVEATIAVETVRAVNTVSANNNGRQIVSTTTATTVRNLQFRNALSP